MKPIHTPFLFCLLIAVAPLLNAQIVVRINGSTTTYKILLPYAAEIEREHNLKIKFVADSTGNGLDDLAAGRADVAMITGDISYFAQLINITKPGEIDPVGIRSFKLPDNDDTAAVAIVHASNPVTQLTYEQLQGLFSGRIANWKEVGGPDLAVVPVLPPPYNGVFGSFRLTIMKGAPFAASAQRVGLVTDLPKVVSSTPGAIAFLSIANAVGDVRKVPPVPKFIPPNYLVTMGDPPEPLKSLIEDFQKRVK